MVARRPRARWELAASLGLPPEDACAPDVAASRLAHPSSPRPDVVLLLVAEQADLAWLRHQAARRDTGRVPVVAAVGTEQDAAAARAAGARGVVGAAASAGEIGRVLRAALGPAVVIDLDSIRTA